MPRLHVCSLALIGETVAKTGARSLMTLLSPGTAVERPTGIEPNRHLYLAVSDIVDPTPGQVLPQAAHLMDLLDFVVAWDRAEPMAIHCFAGVSRSTAAAFIAASAAPLIGRRQPLLMVGGGGLAVYWDKLSGVGSACSRREETKPMAQMLHPKKAKIEAVAACYAASRPCRGPCQIYGDALSGLDRVSAERLGLAARIASD